MPALSRTSSSGSLHTISVRSDNSQSDTSSAPLSTGNNYRLVHSDSDPDHASLISEGAYLQDFAVQKSTIDRLFACTDIVRILNRFDSARYLKLQWNPEALPLLREVTLGLENRLRVANIDPAQRAELLDLTGSVLHQIERLRTDKPVHGVWATKVAFSLIAVALVIPPLIKTAKEQNYQYLSLLMANYLKTLLMAVGIGMNPTADAASYLLNIKERHAPVLISFAPYFLADAVPALDLFARRNPLIFNAMAAAFMTLAFAIMTAPQCVIKPAIAIRRACERLLERVAFRSVDRPEQSAAPLERADFSVELDTLTQLHEDLRERRALFEAQGFRIGDVLSTQLAALDGSLIRLGYGLRDGSPAAAGPMGHTPRQTMAGALRPSASNTQDPEFQGVVRSPEVCANPDFAQKASLAALTAGVCLGSAATYYKEPIGLIGLSVRSGLAVAEMLKTVFNPSEKSSRASEKFSNYSGLSLLLLPYGILNNIPATHFTGTRAGLISGTALLACGNLLLPRPISEWLGRKMVALSALRTSRTSPTLS